MKKNRSAGSLHHWNPDPPAVADGDHAMCSVSKNCRDADQTHPQGESVFCNGVPLCGSIVLSRYRPNIDRKATGFTVSPQSSTYRLTVEELVFRSPDSKEITIQVISNYNH